MARTALADAWAFASSELDCDDFDDVPPSGVSDEPVWVDAVAVSAEESWSSEDLALLEFEVWLAVPADVDVGAGLAGVAAGADPEPELDDGVEPEAAGGVEAFAVLAVPLCVVPVALAPGAFPPP